MKEIAQALVEWLKDHAKKAGASGFVLGLSGGVDSATVGALCKLALPESTLGLMMPCHSNPHDEKDAALTAQALDIPTKRIELSSVLDLLIQQFREETPARKELAYINLKPRLRMLTLYYHANKLHYLVVGTGNKSEAVMGYFTKYGDGGVDLLPLGDLVKSQVRALARYLGVPEPIIVKPPSAGLWEGQTDEGEMGLTYEELDKAIVDIEAGQTSRISPHVLRKIEEGTRETEHKRQSPPIFKLKRPVKV